MFSKSFNKLSKNLLSKGFSFNKSVFKSKKNH